LSRIVITAPVTVAGQPYRKGDVIEASAALVAAIGANARAVSSTGLKDALGITGGILSNGDSQQGPPAVMHT
jgi:hypothetical protein